VVENRVLD